MTDDPKSNSAREPQPKAGGPGHADGAPAHDRPRRERGRGPREGGASAHADARPAGGERPQARDDRGGPPRGDRPRRDDRRDDRRGPPGGPDRRRDTSSPLTASLFSAMQDKEMPCRIGGCDNTWTWFAAQQLRGFGQKPPERMCDPHLAQYSELVDRELGCRTPGCPNTWLWKRGAQLADLQRHGRLKKPARMCNECVAAERETGDVDMPCKVEGCRRQWVWPRDAQLRHRLWVLRQRARARAIEAREAAPGPDAEAPTESPVTESPVTEAVAAAASEAVPSDSAAQASEHVPEDMSQQTDENAPAAPTDGAEVVAAEGAPETERGPNKRRRRRRKPQQHVREVVDPEAPPQRMCGLCAQKLAQIAAKDIPCKVHGCVRTWTWDRAGQLRAWVLSGSDDVNFEPAAPRRMCEACREFCRKHPDRAVPCGRPGCEATWMYKTGAQLQAFLAGRLQDPLKLCDECAKGEFAKQIEDAGLPEGAEIMPCVVPACAGTWVYMPGQRLAPAPAGELAPDRMCLGCRRERGLEPDEPEASAELEVSASDIDDTDDAQQSAALEDSPEPSEADSDAPDGDSEGDAADDSDDTAAEGDLPVEAAEASPAEREASSD